MTFKMTTGHAVVIGGLIVAIGTQLSGTSHGWIDVMTPQFIGGLLVEIGTVIGAIFTGSVVTKTWDGIDRRN